jgi:hypothetical protein
MADAYAQKGQSGHSPVSSLTGLPSMLAYALFALALVALGWRAVSVFTSQAAPVTKSEFAIVADALIGPGKTRVIEGDAGTRLILIDGLEGSLSSANITRLRELAGALYPDAPTITIKQFEFADGSPGKPDAATLGELAWLGLLVMLSAWLAFRTPAATAALASAPPASAYLAQTPPPQQRTVRSQSPDVPPARQKIQLEQVAALAQDKPHETAAIIEKWLRQEEGSA